MLSKELSAMSVKEMLVVGLPWVLSALTVAMTLMQGNKNKYAWALGLFSQVLWSVWIVLSKTWGLVPLNLTLWVLYYRNHRKWMSEAKENSPITKDISSSAGS